MSYSDHVACSAWKVLIAAHLTPDGVHCVARSSMLISLVPESDQLNSHADLQHEQSDERVHLHVAWQTNQSRVVAQIEQRGLLTLCCAEQ